MNTAKKYSYTGANITADGLYRYRLVREWSDQRRSTCCFVMLNPSTADHTVDDPTIRRCVSFAESWGHSRLIVVNLFAFRSTDPRQLRKAADPVGPHNDEYILEAAKESYVGVAAWGDLDSKLRPREDAVKALLRSSGLSIHALGFTLEGHPRHPLYVPGSVVLSRMTA